VEPAITPGKIIKNNLLVKLAVQLDVAHKAYVEEETRFRSGHHATSAPSKAGHHAAASPIAKHSSPPGFSAEVAKMMKSYYSNENAKDAMILADAADAAEAADDDDLGNPTPAQAPCNTLKMATSSNKMNDLDNVWSEASDRAGSGSVLYLGMAASGLDCFQRCYGEGDCTSFTWRWDGMLRGQCFGRIDGKWKPQRIKGSTSGRVRDLVKSTDKPRTLVEAASNLLFQRYYRPCRLGEPIQVMLDGCVFVYPQRNKETSPPPQVAYDLLSSIFNRCTASRT
jgi:hypothetical protein